MANTTNIDLVKPAGTDHALVSVLNANSDKIDEEAGNVRSNFALVQNTNTATQAISKDQLVVWKGVLKKATSNIANGATLSNSNLTDTKVSTELASLSDHIAKQIVPITFSNSSDRASRTYCVKQGNIVMVCFDITTGTMATSDTEVFSIPTAYAPGGLIKAVCLNGIREIRLVIANPDGTIKIQGSVTGEIVGGELFWAI